MAPLMITLTCLYIQNKDNFMVWIIYCNWENTMKNIIWNLLRIICVHIWVKIVECKLEYLGWHVSYQELKIMAHWFQSQMRWKDSGFNLMNTWSKIAQNIIFKVGMGRACFFWIGSSPSPYFLDRVEPGLQILYLEPIRAKKNSVWAYFEPQKYQWK